MCSIIAKNIMKAKLSGYFIELYYAGVASAEIASERVKYRVPQCAHGISERDKLEAVDIHGQETLRILDKDMTEG